MRMILVMPPSEPQQIWIYDHVLKISHQHISGLLLRFISGVTSSKVTHLVSEDDGYI